MAKDDMDLDIVLDEDDGKRKGRIYWLLGALLLIVGSVALTTFIFSERRAPEGDDAPAIAGDGVRYIELRPAFTSNFYQNGRSRLLQLHISLSVRGDATEEAVTLHMPLIRHNVLDLIGREDFQELRAPDGREALRAKILASIQQTIEIESGQAGVENVLFTHFVMQ